MGLADQLGYQHASPGAIRRLVQASGSSRPGAWFFSKTLHHLDRGVASLTGQRTTASEVLAGLPVLYLTTTGAKSGAERVTPLLGIPVAEDLAVLGTGFGQAPTPGWVYNLRAKPLGTVSYRDRTVPITARPGDSTETDSIWTTARTLYPGYAKYPERATHREISVFVLEPR